VEQLEKKEAPIPIGLKQKEPPDTGLVHESVDNDDQSDDLTDQHDYSEEDEDQDFLNEESALSVELVPAANS